MKSILLHTFFLVFLALPSLAQKSSFTYSHGGVIRGDVSKQTLSLVFTGDSYADGGDHILSVLDKQKVKGSFFLTGNFYATPKFNGLIKQMHSAGHYLGAHSDAHLLYNSWDSRDSMFVTREEFETDLKANYIKMAKYGVTQKEAHYFMPPYEWYNSKISKWTKEMGFTLINFSPGTRSNADYTTPDMGKRYLDSQTIYKSIIDHEAKDPNGLNGFILLIHAGTDPKRTDKFYLHLDKLITELKGKGYQFVRVDKLLNSGH